MEDHQEILMAVNYTGSWKKIFHIIVKKHMNIFGLDFIFICPRESEKNHQNVYNIRDEHINGPLKWHCTAR